MSEWIWINGETIPMAEARIDVEDRGFQFADGVYEYFRVYRGKAFAVREHLHRLARSAAGIILEMPLDQAALSLEIQKLVDRSGHRDGFVYLQLTRGISARNHAFPDQTRPTLLFYVRPLPPAPLPGEGEGIKLLTVPDDRWKRCWIKAIALLPNVLAKNAALAAGADEAVFLDNDIVTECAACNIFAVHGNKIMTHPVGSRVLPGITRALLIDIAPTIGLSVDERRFTEEDARRSDELFITSTSREIAWVARWNDRYIGQARCGAVTKRLHQALQDHIHREIAGGDSAG